MNTFGNLGPNKTNLYGTIISVGSAGDIEFNVNLSSWHTGNTYGIKFDSSGNIQLNNSDNLAQEIKSGTKRLIGINSDKNTVSVGSLAAGTDVLSSGGINLYTGGIANNNNERNQLYHLVTVM